MTVEPTLPLLGVAVGVPAISQAAMSRGACQGTPTLRAHDECAHNFCECLSPRYALLYAL